MMIFWAVQRLRTNIVIWTAQEVISSKGTVSLESGLGYGLRQQSRDQVKSTMPLAAQGMIPTGPTTETLAVTLLAYTQ
jgi:hypothetical protein